MIARLTIFLVTYFVFVTPVFSLQITEIQYDPEGTDTKREWVEVYNDSDQSIDLTTYGFLENEVNHGISYYEGPKELAVDAYAIIAADAKTFVDEFNTSVSVYDSVFTLNNTGETIKVLDADEVVVSSVNYSADWGAGGDGNSLNLISGNSWQPRKPSPGKVVSESAAPSSSGTSAKKTRTMDPVSQPKSSQEGVDHSDLPTFAVAEQTIQFAVTGPDSYRYEWLLPNGEIDKGKVATFTPKLPGKISITLEVQDKDGLVLELDHQVDVESPSLVLSSGKYKNQPYLKIANANNSSLDLSNWSILLGAREYQLPEYLLLKSGDDYAFTLKQDLMYPIQVLDTKLRQVVLIKQPTSPTSDSSLNLFDSTSINSKIDSGLTAQASNDLPTSLDFNEAKQERLRQEFESYGEQLPSIDNLEQAATINNLSANAIDSGLYQATERTFSPIRTIVNSLFILLLGVGLTLLLISKRRVADLSGYRNPRNEVLLDEDEDGQREFESEIASYKISVADDEEDF